jgi:hypothetical protein
MYFALERVLPVVGDVKIYKTDYNGDAFESLLKRISGTAWDVASYNVDVSNSTGWDIVRGNSRILYIKAFHDNEEPDSWELRWRYAEMRARFTRAPNVPRTAFIATF